MRLELHSVIMSRFGGSFTFCYNLFMEREPDTVNVSYIDEYPHLEEKLRLQRLARPAVREALHDLNRIIRFELPEPPDGVA